MTTNPRFSVNGAKPPSPVSPLARLCDVLREQLGLTGTNVGCSEGVCGSCTVLVDGQPVRSCLQLAGQCDGSAIETIEGLRQDGGLGPVQLALAYSNAIQCGFCTPGFAMVLESLRRNLPQRPDEAALTGALNAVACRCTGYAGVRRAADAILSGPRE